MTPEYINSHWTEEKLQLMFEKRHQRLMRDVAGIEPPAANPDRVGQTQVNRMTHDAFMAKHGKRLKIKEI